MPPEQHDEANRGRRAVVTELSGAPHQRGSSFGTQRRRQISAWVLAWLDSLRVGGIADPHAYIETFLCETDFSTTIREHAPDLLEEVQGVALGADLPFELLLAAQFMDEEWAYRSESYDCAEIKPKCSSVGISLGHGLTWIGQNMDLGRWTDGHQLLLKISAQRADEFALIFTMGGMISLLGVNSFGVGVCVNSLRQLSSAPRGLPVAFVIRKLLQAESAAKAATIVLSIPHATSQHYLIADASGVRSFEASANEVIEYRSPDPSRVLHTNHPLAAQPIASTSEWYHIDSVTRLQSLTGRLAEKYPDLASIQAALSSCDDPNHPVCKKPVDGCIAGSEIGFTTGSMISALRDDSPKFESWVSAGPPSDRGYRCVQLLDR